jgi:hypothetical protein
MFDLFVLNLKHRLDRRKNFQRLHGHNSIRYEFVDAMLNVEFINLVVTVLVAPI